MADPPLAEPSSNSSRQAPPDRSSLEALETRLAAVLQKQHFLQQILHVHRSNAAIIATGLASLEPVVTNAMLHRQRLHEHVLTVAFGHAGPTPAENAGHPDWQQVSKDSRRPNTAISKESAAQRVASSSPLLRRLKCTSAEQFAGEPLSEHVFGLLLPLLLRELQRCAREFAARPSGGAPSSSGSVAAATELRRWASFVRFGCESYAGAFLEPSRRPVLRAVLVDVEEAVDALLAFELSGPSEGDAVPPLQEAVAAASSRSSAEQALLLELRHTVQAVRTAANLS
jgi:hypothetical protein